MFPTRLLKRILESADRIVMAISHGRAGGTLRKELRALRFLDALDGRERRRERRVPSRPWGVDLTVVELNALPSPWQVFHDLDLGGERVDHVAAGPPGVWDIEVRVFGGAVTADAAGLWTHGRPEPNKAVLVRALRRARALQTLLACEVGTLIVVAAPRLVGRTAWRLPVIPPQELRGHLESLPSSATGWRDLRRAIDVLQRLSR